MNHHSETGAAGKLLLLVMVPAALLFWAFVATASYVAPSSLDGRYTSAGQVVTGSGEVLNVSHSVVFSNGRFYSMTRKAPAILEASGRVETDLRGRIRLHVESGEISGLSDETELDDELLFNLLYGRHKGAQITFERIGACFYGVETQQVYCADNRANLL